jgi:hypothetical protein
MRMGTMGTTSPGLDRKEQEVLPRVVPLSQKTWVRRPMTEAVKKIIIESNLVNRESRDGVRVEYNPNRSNLPCKPYPHSL